MDSTLAAKDYSTSKANEDTVNSIETLKPIHAALVHFYETIGVKFDQTDLNKTYAGLIKKLHMKGGKKVATKYPTTNHYKEVVILAAHDQEKANKSGEKSHKRKRFSSYFFLGNTQASRGVDLVEQNQIGLVDINETNIVTRRTIYGKGRGAATRGNKPKKKDKIMVCKPPHDENRFICPKNYFLETSKLVGKPKKNLKPGEVDPKDRYFKQLVRGGNSSKWVGVGVNGMSQDFKKTMVSYFKDPRIPKNIKTQNYNPSEDFNSRDVRHLVNAVAKSHRNIDNQAYIPQNIREHQNDHKKTVNENYGEVTDSELSIFSDEMHYAFNMYHEENFVVGKDDDNISILRREKPIKLTKEEYNDILGKRYRGIKQSKSTASLEPPRKKLKLSTIEEIQAFGVLADKIEKIPENHKEIPGNKKLKETVKETAAKFLGGANISNSTFNFNF